MFGRYRIIDDFLSHYKGIFSWNAMIQFLLILLLILNLLDICGLVTEDEFFSHLVKLSHIVFPLLECINSSVVSVFFKSWKHFCSVKLSMTSSSGQYLVIVSWKVSTSSIFRAIFYQFQYISPSSSSRVVCIGCCAAYLHIKSWQYPGKGFFFFEMANQFFGIWRNSFLFKIVSCAFSTDNRFVGLATNHGTTHLFAICPYGGPVSMRTHGDKLVNKESR